MVAALLRLGKQTGCLALHRAADADFLPAPSDWLICNPAEEKRRLFLGKPLGARGVQPPLLHTNPSCPRGELCSKRSCRSEQALALSMGTIPLNGSGYWRGPSSVA